jgi:hypothetical protein
MPAILTNQRDFFFLFFILIKNMDNSQCTVTPIGINFNTVTPTGINFDAVTPTGINFDAVTPIGINFSPVTPIGFGFGAVTPIGINFNMYATIGINLRKDLYWYFITNRSRRTGILVQA